MLLALLAASALAVTDRGDCWSNIDGYVYDFRSVPRFHTAESYSRGPYTYYIKLCGNLSLSNLPPVAALLELYDASVVRCNGTTSCAVLVTRNAFDWRLQRPGDPSSGLFYYADGEPFEDDDGGYSTLDIEASLLCNQSIRDADFSWTTSSDFGSREGTIFLSASHSLGCATPTQPPSPTPPADFDCVYWHKFVWMINYGVFIDFAELNDGPFGIRVWMPSQTIPHVVFFQPCERMRCPVGYSCSDPWSSVWLCSGRAHTCVSYGVIDDGINVVGSFSGVQVDYLNVTYRTDTSTTVLNLKCNPVFSFDHFAWLQAYNIDSNNTLHLTALAASACVTLSPTPIPTSRAGMCEVAFANIELNLTAFNIVNGTQGWSAQVSLTGDYAGQTAKLWYQPCAGMGCPSGHQCEGDDYATVWLCLTETTCLAYGLIHNNVTAEAVEDDQTIVRVKYKADRHREAIVKFVENPAVPDNRTIGLPQTVDLKETILSFTAEVRHMINPAPTPVSSGVTGGAVFLLIVAIIAVLYLSVGLLYNLATSRTFQFPNAEFWGEVYLSIVTAIAWIFGHRGASDQVRQGGKVAYGAI